MLVAASYGSNPSNTQIRSHIASTVVETATATFSFSFYIIQRSLPQSAQARFSRPYSTATEHWPSKRTPSVYPTSGPETWSASTLHLKIQSRALDYPHLTTRSTPVQTFFPKPGEIDTRLNLTFGIVATFPVGGRPPLATTPGITSLVVPILDRNQDEDFSGNPVSRRTR
jgi:hypothetical protein